jgi:hypothetical protein
MKSCFWWYPIMKNNYNYNRLKMSCGGKMRLSCGLKYIMIFYLNMNLWESEFAEWWWVMTIREPIKNWWRTPVWVTLSLGGLTCFWPTSPIPNLVRIYPRRNSPKTGHFSLISGKYQCGQTDLTLPLPTNHPTYYIEEVYHSDLIILIFLLIYL